MDFIAHFIGLTSKNMRWVDNMGYPNAHFYRQGDIFK